MVLIYLYIYIWTIDILLHKYLHWWRATIIWGRWEHAELIENDLTLNSYCWIKYYRGTFKEFFDKTIGMFITILKNNKTLQVFSTTMTKNVGQVTRKKIRKSIMVKYPKDNIAYQQHMGRVDCGDQYRLMGEVFVNVSHFKCFSKKYFWGLLVLVSYRDSRHGTWRWTAQRYQ